MISKELLVEQGFVRISGSSAWHHGEADVYVLYKEMLIQGEITKLDGVKATDNQLLKAVKKGIEASVVEDEASVVEDEASVVEDEASVVEDEASVVEDEKLVD